THQYQPLSRLLRGLGSTRGSSAMGTVTSGDSPTCNVPLKPLGVTPTTVKRTFAIVISLPIAPASPPKRRCQYRQLSTAAGAASRRVLPFVEIRIAFLLSSALNNTSCSGCGTGSDFNSTSLISVNSAVLAPMPMASDSTATAVNPG